MNPHGLIVAQPVGPGPPGGLVVKLLQDLDREGQRVLSQDLDGPGALAGLRRVRADGVEEDVGVNQGALRWYISSLVRLSVMEIPTPLWWNSSVISASLRRRLSGSVSPVFP